MFRPRTHAESRGLDDALQSHLLQGRFGRMFRHLPAAEFAATEEETLKILKDLAERMVLNSTPNDGPIPAGYTYLGPGSGRRSVSFLDGWSSNAVGTKDDKS